MRNRDPHGRPAALPLVSEQPHSADSPGWYYSPQQQILLAWAQHHEPSTYQEAFATARETLWWLMSEAGGALALRDILSCRSRSEIGEIAIATLEVYVATLRRRLPKGIVRHQFFEHGLQFVVAYLDGSERVIYPRTPAMAAQWIAALAERSTPGDETLIEALHRLNALDLPVRVRHSDNAVPGALW